MPRRRKPVRKSIVERVAPMISIDGICGIDWEIWQYERVPTHHWPEQLHCPWIWIGSTSSPKPIHRKNYVHINRPQPRLKGVSSVPRALYQAMIAPIPRDRRLRYYIPGESDPLDVNPLHWRVSSPVKSSYPYTPADFVLTAEDLPATVDDELVEMLNDEYARNPFTTWEEFNERFSDLWYDVPQPEQMAALERAGLLSRLK